MTRPAYFLHSFTAVVILIVGVSFSLATWVLSEKYDELKVKCDSLTEQVRVLKTQNAVLVVERNERRMVERALSGDKRGWHTDPETGLAYQGYKATYKDGKLIKVE